MGIFIKKKDFMNTYEISYNYKGYLEVINVNADDILSAIGHYFENTNGKLSDIIKVEVIGK